MPVCIVHTESNSTMLRALCSLVKSSRMRRKLLTSLTVSGDIGDNAEACRPRGVLQTTPGHTGLLRGSVCECAARAPPPPRSRLLVMVLLLKLLISGTH